MYETLIPFHSLIRWLLLVGLVYCLIKSILGLSAKLPYSKLDNIVRAAISGISHIQIVIGFTLYFKSPIVSYFRANTRQAIHYTDIAFFGVYHIAFMLIAILLITIGAAKAKRAVTDYEKHHKILWWFGIATLLICLAIPWPFSPYTSRPYFRML